MPPIKEELTAICSVTLAANLPANSTTPVDITIDPIRGAVQEHTVPADRDWEVVDIYQITAPTTDGVIQIIKNGEEVLAQTAPLSALDVSNPTRPMIAPQRFPAQSKLSMNYINLTAVGAAAETVTFYARIKQLPRGAVGAAKRKGGGIVGAIDRALGKG